MLGRIRKKLIATGIEPIKEAESLICPICDRVIPNSQKDAHHLIPKSKGGSATEYLHRICHRQVHALFNETELAKSLNTAEALKAHPDMQRFVSWVKNKPIGFFQKASKSDRIKSLF